MTNVWVKLTSKEDRLTLFIVWGFQSTTDWLCWAGPVARQPIIAGGKASLSTASKWTEGTARFTRSLGSMTPNDLKPSYLLKVPLPPNSAELGAPHGPLDLIHSWALKGYWANYSRNKNKTNTSKPQNLGLCGFFVYEISVIPQLI